MSAQLDLFGNVEQKDYKTLEKKYNDLDKEFDGLLKHGKQL